jgi:hypothetical protein
VGHSLFQRLGTLGGHLVTEKGDLGCSKDTLRRVDDDPVPLKLVEKSPYVLFMLFESPGEYKDVVQVGETEVESSLNGVHKPLESLGGVSQAEGHEGELE